MSSDYNQENRQQDGYKQLTFKDWKSLKDSRNKTNDKQHIKKKNTKANINNKNAFNKSRYERNYYNNFNAPRIPFVQGASNFLTRSNGQSSFMSTNNYNGNKRSNNFCMQGSNFGFLNNFNNPVNIRRNNFNSNKLNIDRFNNCSDHKNFTKNSNRIIKNFDNFRSSGWNEGNNMNFPNSFFSSDGIYNQKNVMQKPLNNPFRNEQKSNRLLKEFDKLHCAEYKTKQKLDKKVERKKSSYLPTTSGDAIKLCNEPKIYVPNPNAKTDGKPYIPKPKVPEKNLEITKEEKKQQWKEYREAMKPFKNRNFYNAKRVVQRLGKKATSELDEKEIIRLTNAKQIMAEYKARLSAKYPNYIKAEDSCSQMGEIYVLKKKTLNSEFDKQTNKSFQNHGNFGEADSYDVEAGRKIVGGNTH